MLTFRRKLWNNVKKQRYFFISKSKWHINISTRQNGLKILAGVQVTVNKYICVSMENILKTVSGIPN